MTPWCPKIVVGFRNFEFLLDPILDSLLPQEYTIAPSLSSILCAFLYCRYPLIHGDQKEYRIFYFFKKNKSYISCVSCPNMWSILEKHPWATEKKVCFECLVSTLSSSSDLGYHIVPEFLLLFSNLPVYRWVVGVEITLHHCVCIYLWFYI